MTRERLRRLPSVSLLSASETDYPRTAMVLGQNASYWKIEDLERPHQARSKR